MKPSNYTTLGGSDPNFLSTQWTLIQQIQSDPTQRRVELVGDLLTKYWKPVYCYLRRKNYDNEQAKDLSQGFFQEVVLGRELIHQADQAKGRFRTFLLTALDRYVTSQHRIETARKRIPKDIIVALDVIDPAKVSTPQSELTPEESFNYAWMSDLLDKVVAEVQAECRTNGMITHWHLFYARILQPTLNNTHAPALSEICTRYHVEDNRKASSMIYSVKRRFQAALRRHLRQLVESESDIQEELQLLQKYFPPPK
ncbi:MAG: sigma-70 family RNA polymerase sigma factor [Sedimentisphaerales bacterium]|nr:sigma-70 family RNA polymerase sigma factor [Sedimentisphaerales bacterium]